MAVQRATWRRLIAFVCAKVENGLIASVLIAHCGKRSRVVTCCSAVVLWCNVVRCIAAWCIVLQRGELQCNVATLFVRVLLCA